MTLGEKLRQAREHKGFTLSEVAEQTRISPLYLESIENDDYSILPGGIFNKGFVKSYAKFVGINEQEALQDYSSLISQNEGAGATEEPRAYRPQVLTDGGQGRSMLPTAITAIVILGVMTAGILFLLNYLRGSGDAAPAATAKPSPVSSNAEVPVNANTEGSPASDAPSMASLKVEFKATTAPISLSANSDGTRSSKEIPAGGSEIFEPKESLKLSYSRSLAQFAQLTINGKQIATPAAPIDGKRAVIEFEINKDTLPVIWKNASISREVPEVTPGENTNATAPPTATIQTRSTPKPANTAGTNANLPAAAGKPPTGNTVRSNPTPKGTVITIPSANRPGNRPPQ
jgi:cytoskeleton protein RodZ